MNNSPDPRDPSTRLMAETFHDEWSTGPAAAMAQRAAAHARTRRRTGRALTAGSAVALVALAAWVSLSRRAAPTASAPVSSASVTPAPSALAATASPFTVTPATGATKSLAYEIISDAELEALMRDRAVLILPQHDGAKKIVVLDR